MTTPTRHAKGLKLQVKDADKGLVEAVFATFDVIDHDHDVTLKGAFEDGAPVPIGAYGHGSVGWIGTDPPIGKAIIRVTEADARIEGMFFLNTDQGRETFEVVKAMAELQQWSYWYDPLEWEMGQQDGQRVRFLKKLKVHEVCPVLVAAGVGTETVDIKVIGAPAEVKEVAETEAAAALRRAIAREFLRFQKTRARLAA